MHTIDRYHRWVGPQEVFQGPIKVENIKFYWSDFFRLLKQAYFNVKVFGFGSCVLGPVFWVLCALGGYWS